MGCLWVVGEGGGCGGVCGVCVCACVGEEGGCGGVCVCV